MDAILYIALYILTLAGVMALGLSTVYAIVTYIHRKELNRYLKYTQAKISGGRPYRAKRK